MRILLCAITILLTLVAALGLIRHHGASPTARDSAPGGASPTAPDSAPSGDRRPVIVELFTSEGCSSCPPADALLSRLQDSQPIPGAEIITLSEHVDYWNHLGWKDPYSSSQFSARQQRYADGSGGEDIYTPQMIVDGQKGFVGSNESQARAAITKAAEAPAGKVTLSLQDASSTSARNQIGLTVHVDGLPASEAGRPLEVLLAITESGLRSSVRSGENGGRTLLHTSVVRKLVSIGNINTKSDRGFDAQPVVRTDSSWRKERLRAVVFVQEKSRLGILGAASLDLSGS